MPMALLQLGNISRVQTRLGPKTGTNLRRSSWRTIELFHGLGIGSWSPKLGEWVYHLYASHKTTHRGSQRGEEIGSGGWENFFELAAAGAAACESGTAAMTRGADPREATRIERMTGSNDCCKGE